MALNGLFCADVPLKNYSLTHSLAEGHILTRKIGINKVCRQSAIDKVCQICLNYKVYGGLVLKLVHTAFQTNRVTQ